MQPVVRGELLDGVRTEKKVFFSPSGKLSQVPDDPDHVGFNFRLPMPDDSLFDVYASLDYLGEWKDDKGVPDLDNLRKAVNLRKLYIGRHYLSPKELDERNFAKRKQYGYMNLRTGMLCPETGWWEGWTVQNHVDKQVIRQSQLFPQASLGPNRTAPDGDGLSMLNGCGTALTRNGVTPDCILIATLH